MDDLNPRQQKFVKAYVLGRSAAAAARIAGYSRNYARSSAFELARKPAVAEAIAEAKKQIRDHTLMDAKTYFEKLETAYCLAIEHKQMTAAMRALELEGKLAGLLTERFLLEEKPSILAALEAARARVRLPDVAAHAKLIEGKTTDEPRAAVDGRTSEVPLSVKPAAARARAGLPATAPDPNDIFGD